MKQGIHPEYAESEIVCTSCGNVIRTKSTRANLKIDKCSNCHYIYTGERQRNADTGGRIGRFKSKYKMG